ncbi:unnamed protein product [Haemonchus placei]|uniref:Uncharacterized protein n=1 Tax=Haemonchus placei TaxID=6290 RepID=A0A3P7UT78_HAEPC|nr:unnamed protein product [Haemonchus placei]
MLRSTGWNTSPFLYSSTLASGPREESLGSLDAVASTPSSVTPCFKLGAFLPTLSTASAISNTSFDINSSLSSNRFLVSTDASPSMNTIATSHPAYL